jgi:hypothetical protein
MLGVTRSWLAWGKRHRMRSQLGKLRAFGAQLGADLGKRAYCEVVGLGGSPRDAPLFPARSGAPVVRSGNGLSRVFEIGVRRGCGGQHPGVMSRWKLYDNWYADLAGLSVEQLRERRAFAAERAEGAVARGMGRNPKAGREWRQRLRAVDDELLRRGVQGA